jgi:hypothetical protein
LGTIREVSGVRNETELGVMLALVRRVTTSVNEVLPVVVLIVAVSWIILLGWVIVECRS